MMMLMKNMIVSIVLWLLMSSSALAQLPNATVVISSANLAQSPLQYRLTLTVPKDHHAYLDQGDEAVYIPVTFDSDNALAAAGLVIDKLTKPTGSYDPLVKATVLRDQGEFLLALVTANGQALTLKQVTLAVKYQLCNDVTHVCFRPQTVKVNMPLALTVPAEQQDDSTDIMARLLALFSDHQDNMLLMFGLMFIAGLLSVATPCVYPMLPITSMFIVNRAQGQAHKEKQHALVYLIGIVGTYMALGLIAGMTGGAFNSFMQSALVNLAFAVFFAFFAIALLGFYELGFMQNEVHSLDQHSARVKGLTGTWLMGTVAGLVISPCVGPIVFALLLHVADNIADKADALALLKQQLSFWQRLEIAAQGSVMMAGFGLGVALPFFLVSVVKFKKLPKAGYWMNKIKYAFGVMILYFAYVYLQKGMGVLGVNPATTLTLALGVLVVWIAVVFCNVLTLLPVDALPNQKMQRYCGVMALLVGSWLVVASLGQLPFVATNPAPSAAAQHTETLATIQEEGGINWYRNFAVAQKVAQQTGKPIFIDFYASWCANCIAFKEEAATNSALNQALRDHAITVKLIDQEPEFEHFRNSAEHRQLKIGLPYFAVLTADGKLIWSGTDYKATQKMIAVLTQGAV